MIVAAFNSLKTVALAEYPNEFRPFVDYFERQWIKTEGPSGFSVWLEETRTSCAVEATNGALSRNFPKNTNLFNFINYLLDKELMYSIRLRNMFDQCSVKKKRASSKADNEIIFKASKLLERDEITVDQFLEHIAKMKMQRIDDLKLSMLSDDSDSDDEIAAPSTSQQTNRLLSEFCVMCGLNPKSVVFLPCAHAVVCSECCYKKFQKKDKMCNLCMIMRPNRRLMSDELFEELLMLNVSDDD